MNSELWSRLQAFDFDEAGVVFCFSDRLARENGWSVAYARRVIEEYRRFLYLCVEAGHPVTPSDEVDQAWHLHLCYTRSYWEQLCDGVLGQKIHHGPTKGGADEGAKFRDWYGRTMASYRAHFGEEPPVDVWPIAEERFRVRAFKRVDARESWVLPKRMVKMVALVMLCGLVLVGCDASRFEDYALLIFLGFFILMVGFIASKKGGGGGGRGGGCGGGIGCSAGGNSGCGGGGCGGGCGGD